MTIPIGAVYSGAGTLGSSEVGAAQALEDAGYAIKDLVTTSAGSILGGMLALGHKASKLKSVVEEANYAKLIPIDIFSYPRFITKGYLASNDYAIEWLKKITGYAQAKDLVMPLKTLTTDLQTGKTYVMDSIKNPNMYLWEMILPSMSIPDVFPTYLEKYVDGGVANNLGINYLTTKHRKIAFRVYEPLRKISKFSLISRQIRLVNIMLATDEHLLVLLGKELGVEIVNLPVPNGLSFLDTKMTLPQKMMLYQTGYNAVHDYLNNVKG